MPRLDRFVVATALTVLTAPMVFAAERAALLVGNERYRELPRASDGARALDAKDRLEAAGFTVVSVKELKTGRISEALSLFQKEAEDAEYLFMLLTGQFVTTGTTTWYMPIDAPEPSVGELPTTAIPVSLLLDLAAQVPGRAVVGLGVAERSYQAKGPISGGLGRIEPPKNVTVLTGPAGRLADFMNASVLEEGNIVASEMRARGRGLKALGYLPQDRPYLPEPARADRPVNVDAEANFWSAVQEIGTVSAYETYLEKYPRGRFAREAQNRLDALNDAPRRDAEAAEKALGLNREQRRQVQRNLALLGFDPKGIDGIFGPATRGALRAWQRDAGLADTGYLNRQQFARLDSEAQARARVLEEEDRRRAEEQRRADQAYWRDHGRAGDEEGLRDYLQRYPDGLFADQAKAGLRDIEEQRKLQSQARERTAWENAVQSNTVEAYRQYLADYPQGNFRNEAESRIAELRDQGQRQQIEAQAKQEEDQLALAQVTFLLVEKRLEQLGLNPGPVDGQLTEESRRAIRNFQRTRELPVTGYLSRQTVVRLIAEVR